MCANSMTANSMTVNSITVNSMTVKHGSSVSFILPFADTDHSGFGIQCFHSMAVTESTPPAAER